MKKLLAKLSVKQRQKLMTIVQRIIEGDLAGLDVKKLQGHERTYRVRTGDFRIVFLKDGDEPDIIAIERRSETTYKDF